MLSVLETFFGRLRDAGVPVSIHESLDAVRAAGVVDITDREVLRSALAASIVKDDAHRPPFDSVFDVTFAGVAVEATDEESAPEAIRRALEEATRRGDLEAVRALGRQAARALSGVGEQQSGPGYFTHRAMRALGAEEVWARLLEAMRGTAGLDAALGEAGVAAARDVFEEAVRGEVLRMLVEDRGAETVTRWTSRPLPEDLELVTATRDELEALTKAIRPLARRLATRLAKRKRSGRHGRLDVRRTMRIAMSTGGVPFTPRFRRKHPHRPELYLLCDVSGSVAAFSRFTLQFVHALQNQFRAVRSFAFVDTLDEVTEDFRGGGLAPILATMIGRARVVYGDGHSDYGSSLRRFEQIAGESLNHRSVVIVLGDARNNYREPRAEVLDRVADRVHRVYWLNPEPDRWWNTGDSVVDAYSGHVDGMFECRNLRQLEAFIERLA